MDGFDFEIGGVTIKVPTGCELAHRIRGDGRKITDQAAWVGCDDFTGTFTRGLCNWRIDFHYADTNGKTYKINKGKTHTSCDRGPVRQVKTNHTLPHYGKACAHFLVNGKTRGVQCHFIVK